MDEWINTRQAYQELIRQHPTLAYQLLHLINAVHMDCKNNVNQTFSDMEASIRNMGKQYDE